MAGNETENNPGTSEARSAEVDELFEKIVAVCDLGGEFKKQYEAALQDSFDYFEYDSVIAASMFLAGVDIALRALAPTLPVPKAPPDSPEGQKYCHMALYETSTRSSALIRARDNFGAQISQHAQALLDIRLGDDPGAIYGGE